MADFEIYIDDDRYSVPSLYLISASGVAGARAMAEELLQDSDHHQGVELRCEGEPIYTLGSFAGVPLARSGAAADTAEY